MPTIRVGRLGRAMNRDKLVMPISITVMLISLVVVVAVALSE
jgi:hypothetical protein